MIVRISITEILITRIIGIRMARVIAIVIRNNRSNMNNKTDRT